MDSTAIFDAVRSVTGAWARQRKSEEREASRISRRRDALIRSRRMTIREAAWSAMHLVRDREPDESEAVGAQAAVGWPDSTP